MVEYLTISKNVIEGVVCIFNVVGQHTDIFINIWSALINETHTWFCVWVCRVHAQYKLGMAFLLSASIYY